MSGITIRPYYFLGLTIPLSVIIGNSIGGFYVGTATFIGLVIFPLLDLIWGEGEDSNPEDVSSAFFDAILYMHVILQFVAISSFINFVSPSDSADKAIVINSYEAFSFPITL